MDEISVLYQTAMIQSIEPIKLKGPMLRILMSLFDSDLTSFSAALHITIRQKKTQKKQQI